MTSNEIRQKFKDFFAQREHAILDSAPLITSDDKGVTDSTLFNTAGVQPLIPYLLGEDHPAGNRLASAQKCIRTIDIDEVGDNTHLTFFEMLGNWSLGDYFKEEAIQWSYEFLTNSPKEGGLGLAKERLYITVFEGDENAPRDDEAAEIWKKYVPENRIYFMSAESNWWAAGDNGPCGPDTEMFYDVTEDGLGDLTREEFIAADDNQQVVEVWNDVFMQYEKQNGKIIGRLSRQGVDTGAGLERITAVVNNVDSVYETDGFAEIISTIKDLSKEEGERAIKIIADHVRSAFFLISEGLEPSNTDRGYILRRLIRRAVRNADKIGMEPNTLQSLITIISKNYADAYPDLAKPELAKIFDDEETKFRKTLNSGLKEFEKIANKDSKISGENAFKLFSTYGFPIELIQELSNERNISVDMDSFNQQMQEHQEKSRTAAEGKFKGGLESMGETEIKYHTATHLLHQALRDVLGNGVEQKGSNINSDRLRFDFTHSEKMTDEQKQRVEEIVNEKIAAALPVNQIELPKEEALKTGAMHLFADKYGDIVSIYYIGDSLETAYSKEFCGGPHVTNTSALGHFKIKKEEASSAGVRRIKAILE